MEQMNIKTKWDAEDCIIIWGIYSIALALILFGWAYADTDSCAAWITDSLFGTSGIAFGGGTLCLWLTTKLVYRASKSKMEERYKQRCGGTRYVRHIGEDWTYCAQTIPHWDAFSSAVCSGTCFLLSPENVILIERPKCNSWQDYPRVNIHDFSQCTEEKNLTTDEMLLLVQHGDEDLRSLFAEKYAGHELPVAVIEAIYEKDPLWIFSFRYFTEDQLSEIIDKWSPLELQGVTTNEKKGTRTPVLGAESAEEVNITATSPENIMNLMTLVSPRGALMEKLVKKLEGKVILPPK